MFFANYTDILNSFNYTFLVLVTLVCFQEIIAKNKLPYFSSGYKLKCFKDDEKPFSI